MEEVITQVPEHLGKDPIHLILQNQHVYTTLTLLIGAVLSYLTVRVNKLKLKHDLDVASQEEMLKSTKRVALRSEYLQIYNSGYFTNKQKYALTRSVIDNYTAINGNHYIHELDEELKSKAEGRPDEID